MDNKEFIVQTITALSPIILLILGYLMPSPLCLGKLKKNEPRKEILSNPPQRNTERDNDFPITEE